MSQTLEFSALRPKNFNICMFFFVFLVLFCKNLCSFCFKLLKLFLKYRIPFFTVSPTYSICKVHGYLVGQQFECPKCKAEKEKALKEKLKTLQAEKEKVLAEKN